MARATSTCKTSPASATTISRVSKCLNYGSGGYERALSIIEHAADDGEE